MAVGPLSEAADVLRSVAMLRQGHDGSRQEGRKKRRTPRRAHAELLRRPGPQGLPLALLQRSRRTREEAGLLKLVQQPLCLVFGDTEQIGDQFGITDNVIAPKQP
jgi:hypothetical protein